MQLIKETTVSGNVKDVFKSALLSFKDKRLGDYPDYYCVYNITSKDSSPVSGFKQLMRFATLNINVCYDEPGYVSIVEGEFARIECIPAKNDKCTVKLFAETDPEKWFSSSEGFFHQPVDFALKCLAAGWQEKSNLWNKYGVSRGATSPTNPAKESYLNISKVLERDKDNGTGQADLNIKTDQPVDHTKLTKAQKRNYFLEWQNRDKDNTPNLEVWLENTFGVNGNDALLNVKPSTFYGWEHI